MANKVLLAVASTLEALTGLVLIIVPSTVEATVPRLRAMLIYNVLTAVYLGYLCFGRESIGKLLLPAFAVHAVLTILFVGVAFKHQIT
jgi:hypothetical protein